MESLVELQNLGREFFQFTGKRPKKVQEIQNLLNDETTDPPTVMAAVKNGLPVMREVVALMKERRELENTLKRPYTVPFSDPSYSLELTERNIASEKRKVAALRRQVESAKKQMNRTAKKLRNIQQKTRKEKAKATVKAQMESLVELQNLGREFFQFTGKRPKKVQEIQNLLNDETTDPPTVMAAVKNGLPVMREVVALMKERRKLENTLKRPYTVPFSDPSYSLELTERDIASEKRKVAALKRQVEAAKKQMNRTAKKLRNIQQKTRKAAEIKAEKAKATVKAQIKKMGVTPNGENIEALKKQRSEAADLLQKLRRLGIKIKGDSNRTITLPVLRKQLEKLQQTPQKLRVMRRIQKRVAPRSPKLLNVQAITVQPGAKNVAEGVITQRQKRTERLVQRQTNDVKRFIEALEQFLKEPQTLADLKAQLVKERQRSKAYYAADWVEEVTTADLSNAFMQPWNDTKEKYMQQIAKLQRAVQRKRNATKLNRQIRPMKKIDARSRNKMLNKLALATNNEAVKNVAERVKALRRSRIRKEWEWSVSEENKQHDPLLQHAVYLALRQALRQRIKDTRQLLNLSGPYACIEEYLKAESKSLFENSSTNPPKCAKGFMNTNKNGTNFMIRNAPGGRLERLVRANNSKAFRDQILELQEQGEGGGRNKGTMRDDSKMSTAWLNRYGGTAATLGAATNARDRAEQNGGIIQAGAPATQEHVRQYWGQTRVENLRGQKEKWKLDPTTDPQIFRTLQKSFYHGFCRKQGVSVPLCSKDIKTELRPQEWRVFFSAQAQQAGFSGTEALNNARKKNANASTKAAKDQMKKNVCHSADCDCPINTTYCPGMITLVKRAREDLFGLSQDGDFRKTLLRFKTVINEKKPRLDKTLLTNNIIGKLRKEFTGFQMYGDRTKLDAFDVTISKLKREAVPQMKQALEKFSTDLKEFTRGVTGILQSFAHEQHHLRKQIKRREARSAEEVRRRFDSNPKIRERFSVVTDAVKDLATDKKMRSLRRYMQYALATPVLAGTKDGTMFKEVDVSACPETKPNNNTSVIIAGGKQLKTKSIIDTYEDIRVLNDLDFAKRVTLIYHHIKQQQQQPLRQNERENEQNQQNQQDENNRDFIFATQTPNTTSRSRSRSLAAPSSRGSRSLAAPSSRGSRSLAAPPSRGSRSLAAPSSTPRPQTASARNAPPSPRPQMASARSAPSSPASARSASRNARLMGPPATSPAPRRLVAAKRAPGA